MGINRKFFFDQCRQTLFTGKLSQGQVDGLSPGPFTDVAIHFLEAVGQHLKVR